MHGHCVLLALLLLGAAHALTYTFTSDPYPIPPTAQEERDKQIVPRPAGNFLITEFNLVVLDVDGNVIDLHEQREDVYFHHGVLHSWNESMVDVVHYSQNLFSPSPDMIGQDMWYTFPPGYGVAVFEDDPHWALCIHALNFMDSVRYLRMRFTMEYRELRPDDKHLMLHFLGDKARWTDVPHGSQQMAHLHKRGRIQPGHGVAEIIAVQWHSHVGIQTSVLKKRTAALEETIIDTVFPERDGEVATNDIYEHALVYLNGAVHVDPMDAMYIDSLAYAQELRTSLREQDPIMYYVLMYMHYEDNWRNSGDYMYFMNDHGPYVQYDRPHTPA